MHRQQGFTLIELLIVLAILGMLVGIVAMSVSDLTDTAMTQAMESEKEIVQTAIDTYNTQNVTVNSEPTIAPQTSPIIIDVSETTSSRHPFAVHLIRDTKYAYEWSEGGEVVTVSVPSP